MRGTILKRAKASWTIIVDVGRGSDGRRNQRWITVKGTRKEAERRLVEILDKVNNGLYIKPSQDTLGDFMGTWLVDHISTRVRPTTLDGYRWRAKSIIDASGTSGCAICSPITSRATTGPNLMRGYPARR